MTARDTLPNSLLALNWLTNNTLHFDNFRSLYSGESLPWFFVEAPNGHLTSSYPIGTAIVTFPLYAGVVLYLKLVGLFQTGIFDLPPNIPDIVDPAFLPYQRAFQKIVATIATALSVAIFYLAVRLKFTVHTALITAFIFAFATSSWTISAQALWQHTALNLVMSALLLCLLKLNRTAADRQKPLLLVAGFLTGLLPGIRPVSLLYLIAIALFVFIHYRKRFIYFAVGLFSLAFSITWNFYYFGISPSNLFAGGYVSLLQDDIAYYNFSPSYFLEAFGGLLISPSRGWLLYSPIMLLALPGIILICQKRSDRDNQLIGALAIASLAVFINYCFFYPWHAGITYGPRFLTDILPIVCYLIAWFLELDFASMPRKLSWGLVSLFIAALLFSTSVQAVGAFGNYHSWETAPYSYLERLWDRQDTEIKRTATSLYYRIRQPIKNTQIYLESLDGIIQSVNTVDGQPIGPLWMVDSNEMVRIQADLFNSGLGRWFSYKTGMNRGETRVQVNFIKDGGQLPLAIANPTENQLFLSENAGPGETKMAIGTIVFPSEPGNYRMEMRLVVNRIGDFKGNLARLPHVVNVRVQPS